MELKSLKAVFIRELRRVYDDIANDRCELDEEQIEAALQLIMHRPLSRDEALDVLGWSSTKFANAMNAGDMPKGRSRKGWKELVWYKDEILEAKKKLMKQ